jgi:hypothetical protein
MMTSFGYGASSAYMYPLKRKARKPNPMAWNKNELMSPAYEIQSMLIDLSDHDSR